MTHLPPELLPVIQITVPLLVGLFIAGWFQNKRIDDVRADMARMHGETLTELRAIRAEMSKQGERLTRLEERSSPLVRR